VDELLAQMEEQKEVLIRYLSSKVIMEDWHGVADAAMDLRELEARFEVLKLVKKGKISVD
jgi:hypothetical protein